MGKRDQTPKPELLIGDIVRLRRNELGLTIKELAERANLGVASIHALEHNRLTIQLNNFLRVLEVLDLSVQDLFGDRSSTKDDLQFDLKVAKRARANLAEFIKQIARALPDNSTSRDRNDRKKSGK